MCGPVEKKNTKTTDVNFFLNVYNEGKETGKVRQHE